MRNNIFSILNDILIYVLIFSFFNDNFSVELLGEDVLKIIFFLFIMFNGHTILKNIKKMTLLQDKLFFIFIISFLIIFLLQIIISMPINIIRSIFMLLGYIAIISYFSFYPLKKTLYSVWVTMMASIVMCYFNDPVTQFTFRTTGGTGDPNEFATQLLAFMFTSIYLFKTNNSKIFIVLTTLFFIYGLFMAGSKSSFLTLGFIFLLYLMKFLFYNFKDLFNYKLFFGLLIIIVVVTLVDFTHIKAVENMLTRTESTGTAHQRLEAWTAGLHMIERNPLLGVGIDEYSNNTRKYYEGYIYATAPHNIYVKLFAETGIFTFVLFLFFITTLLIQGFKILANENEIWLFFAFISFLIMGMTLGFFSDKYFWLFVAIIMNTYRTMATKNISR